MPGTALALITTAAPEPANFTADRVTAGIMPDQQGRTSVHLDEALLTGQGTLGPTDHLAGMEV